MRKKIAARLRAVRGEMPQASFAARIGLSQTAWHRYETGKNEMSYAQLHRLCVEFGVSLDWLFGLGGDGAKPPAAAPARRGSGPCRECARLWALVDKQSAALAECASALARNFAAGGGAPASAVMRAAEKGSGYGQK